MHYVELDVNNLRRWLAGQFAGVGAPSGVNAKNENGYIVYFSDRRDNKNHAGAPARRANSATKTTVNSGASAAGTPNGGQPIPAKMSTATRRSTSMAGQRATCRPVQLPMARQALPASTGLPESAAPARS